MLIACIILVLVLFFVFAYFFRDVFFFNSDFGELGLKQWSSCKVNKCGKEGTQILHQKCFPNSNTGLGCLYEGKQIFKSLIFETRNCEILC